MCSFLAHSTTSPAPVCRCCSRLPSFSCSLSFSRVLSACLRTSLKLSGSASIPLPYRSMATCNCLHRDSFHPSLMTKCYTPKPITSTGSYVGSYSVFFCFSNNESHLKLSLIWTEYMKFEAPRGASSSGIIFFIIIIIITCTEFLLFPLINSVTLMSLEDAK